MNTLNSVSGINYIEFSYSPMTTSIFDVAIGNCALLLSGLVAQGKIKDPDPFTLTEDNTGFLHASGAAAVQSAFNLMSQLSRELAPIIAVTEFDVVNNWIKIRIGYKSTINDASLSVWDSAIKNYLIAYILRDWYAIFIPENNAGLPEKALALFNIAYARSISDLSWLTVGTVEAARVSLEEAMYEYIDETIVTK